MQGDKASKVKLEKGRPDSFFVARLSGTKPSLARDAVLEAEKDVALRQEIEETLAGGGRSSYIQICAPFELQALTRIKRPKHIVEVGVSAGVSSAYFLHALDLNGAGLLHSIDLPEREEKGERPKRFSWALPLGREPGWSVPSYLKKNWDLRLGRSGDLLPGLLEEIDRVDIFLYDVPYKVEQAKREFGLVDEKIDRGSIALADNCLVPIRWWAKKRNASVYPRKNSGLRGFFAS